MSRGFVKDGDQEEVPVVTPRAFLPPGAVNYVTAQGLAALQAEKEGLLAQIGALQAGTDADSRFQRTFVEAKLTQLEERLRTAVVVSPPTKAKSKVAFGAYVTLQKEGEAGSATQAGASTGAPRTVRITGADEADALHAISYFSPLAKALSGHKKGDSVRITMPAGEQVFTILAVAYTPAPNPSDPTRATSAASPSALQKAASPKKAAPTKPLAPRATPTPAPTPTPTPTPASTSAQAPSAPLEKAPSAPASENLNEIFPLVNERGVTIGRAARWQCHDGSKLLHPVVHLHLFNSQGQLYLQKRPAWKAIQPGKWDTSVGGHMGFGEKPEQALHREAQEELGITSFTPHFLKRYVFESPREKELIHIYRTVYDGPIAPSNELDGGRFWTLQEIRENLGKKVFTPNFESEFKMISK